MGIDDTSEGRKGKKIKVKGIYQRPSALKSCVSGLLVQSIMLLVEIPWVLIVWALPFLTALAPSVTLL